MGITEVCCTPFYFSWSDLAFLQIRSINARAYCAEMNLCNLWRVFEYFQQWNLRMWILTYTYESDRNESHISSKFPTSRRGSALINSNILLSSSGLFPWQQQTLWPHLLFSPPLFLQHAESRLSQQQASCSMIYSIGHVRKAHHKTIHSETLPRDEYPCTLLAYQLPYPFTISKDQVLDIYTLAALWYVSWVGHAIHKGVITRIRRPFCTIMLILRWRPAAKIKCVGYWNELVALHF